ncbi:MAG: hypothetical protein ABIT76_04795 [Chthoniobacterales bacterium]
MRTSFIAFFLLAFAASVSAQQRDYPRDLFGTAQPVTGATPFPDYDPLRLNQLYSKRHEIELQMFDIINEAAVRHDPKLKQSLDLYEKTLGYVPLLAVAHYKYVFGDKSQLDWLLAEDKKRGIGRDSLIITVFGYMDEWDKTIRWMKQNVEYNDQYEGGGASGEVVAQAIEIRKRLYGAKRFEKAWKAAKTK